MQVSNVKEADKILRLYKNHVAKTVKLEFFRGLRFNFLEQCIEVLIDAHGNKVSHADLGVTDRFKLEAHDLSGSFPVKLVPEKIYNAHQELDSPQTELLTEAPFVQAGRAVNGAGLNGYGTLGWIIRLDGRLVGVSNWHVLCPTANTPPGNPVVDWLTGLQIGILAERQIDELWDLALGALREDLVDLLLMAPCDDGSHMPVPRRLGTAEDVAMGITYVKVGARGPICREGRLHHYGPAKVRYNDGTVRQFVDQIYFTKMSDPGDSGAIIFSKPNQRVVGLNFAGDDTVSIANPLYRKGWIFNGTRILKNGLEVPEYFSNSSLADAEELPARGTAAKPSFAGGPLPPIFEANRKVQMRLLTKLPNQSFEFMLRVYQPYGDWVQVAGPQFGDRGEYLPGGSWLHVPTGMLYWAVT